jgi:hypothetical protein
MVPRPSRSVVVLWPRPPARAFEDMIEQQLFEPAGMTRSRVVLGTLARDWRTFWYERFSVFYQEYGPTVATATDAVRVRPCAEVRSTPHAGRRRLASVISARAPRRDTLNGQNVGTRCPPTTRDRRGAASVACCDADPAQTRRVRGALSLPA